MASLTSAGTSSSEGKHLGIEMCRVLADTDKGAVENEIVVEVTPSVLISSFPAITAAVTAAAVVQVDKEAEEEAKLDTVT
jgi:hypothetical protein